MHRRLIALFLVLAIAAALLPVASAAEYEGLHIDAIKAALRVIMFAREGTYTSVTPQDSNAVSIGFVQWHGGQAWELLMEIIERNPTKAKSILGDTFYGEIVGGSYKSWSNRSVTSEEKRLLQELLGTPESIAAQDARADRYFDDFIKASWKAGMRTDATVTYYSTMYNQWGSGGVQTYMKYIRATMGVDTSYLYYSLDAFHTAVLNTNYGQAYIKGRKYVYEYIKSLGWNTSGPDQPGTPSVPEQPRVNDCPNCPGAAFYDMPAKSNWAHEAIEFVLQKGLFNGVDKTHFDPNGTMTRAMLVTVLYRLDGQKTPAKQSSFADVKRGQWYTDAVDWASAEDLIQGVSDTRFAPNDPLTREQLVTLLDRFSQYQGKYSPVSGSLSGYADEASVSLFAVEHMRWAVAAGILKGVTENGVTALQPKQPVTRAQVALMLMRYCNL